MNDPELEINWNGELYVANRTNTYMFTFFGELALFNHVYLVPTDGEEQRIGGYVWSDHKAYEPLVDFVQVYNHKQSLNADVVSDGDKAAYKQAHPGGLWLPGDTINLPKGEYKDLEDLYFTDSFPPEWLE